MDCGRGGENVIFFLFNIIRLRETGYVEPEDRLVPEIKI